MSYFFSNLFDSKKLFGNLEKKTFVKRLQINQLFCYKYLKK